MLRGLLRTARGLLFDNRDAEDLDLDCTFGRGCAEMDEDVNTKEMRFIGDYVPPSKYLS
jgi:hypothetical protein